MSGTRGAAVQSIPVKAHELTPAPLTCAPIGNSYDGKLSPGLKALGELPFAAWVQILGAIAVIELTVGKQDYENKVRSTSRTSCVARDTAAAAEISWCNT